jgi:hypothetical protein
MNLKTLERYLRVNLFGPGPRLMKKVFTGPRSHKGRETLVYIVDIYQMSYWYDWFSWWWAQRCSKHVENWNKHIRKKGIVHQVGYLQELDRDARSSEHKILRNWNWEARRCCYIAKKRNTDLTNFFTFDYNKHFYFQSGFKFKLTFRNETPLAVHN